MSAPDLQPNIQANAQGPKTVTVDGVSATANSIPDQIEADKYGKANDALSGTTRRGLMITKIRPPGSI